MANVIDTVRQRIQAIRPGILTTATGVSKAPLEGLMSGGLVSGLGQGKLISGLGSGKALSTVRSSIQGLGGGKGLGTAGLGSGQMVTQLRTRLTALRAGAPGARTQTFGVPPTPSTRRPASGFAAKIG